MVRMTWFENESDLSRLTGLDHHGLESAGFCLDDWDWGIRTNRKIHVDRLPEDVDPELAEPVVSVDWDGECSWLMHRMAEWCVGPSYVKFGRWHYYLMHHA